MGKGNWKKYDEEYSSERYYIIQYHNSEEMIQIAEEYMSSIDWDYIDKMAKKCGCDTVEIITISEKIERYSLKEDSQ